MKRFFVHSLTCITLILALSLSGKAYSQKSTKGGSHTAVNKEMLSGTWKSGEEEFTFDKEGTSLIKAGNRECPGTWVLKGNTLTINPKKLMYKKGDPCSKARTFKVVSLSAQSLEMSQKGETRELHLVKQK